MIGGEKRKYRREEEEIIQTTKGEEERKKSRNKFLKEIKCVGLNNKRLAMIKNS
jgi:hypothetical protein